VKQIGQLKSVYKSTYSRYLYLIDCFKRQDMPGLLNLSNNQTIADNANMQFDKPTIWYKNKFKSYNYLCFIVVINSPVVDMVIAKRKQVIKYFVTLFSEGSKGFFNIKVKSYIVEDIRNKEASDTESEIQYQPARITPAVF